MTAFSVALSLCRFFAAARLAQSALIHSDSETSLCVLLLMFSDADFSGMGCAKRNGEAKLSSRELWAVSTLSPGSIGAAACACRSNDAPVVDASAAVDAVESNNDVVDAEVERAGSPEG